MIKQLPSPVMVVNNFRVWLNAAKLSYEACLPDYIVILHHSYSQAQDEKNKDLQSLIETELAFARMAKNQNTRDAFLRYLSDETVMFMDAGITIGKKNLEKPKSRQYLIDLGTCIC
jgi:hypothetical protein